MAIPVKRYDVRSGDTNTPVVDFTEIDGRGPINADIPSPVSTGNTTKYDINKFSGTLSLVNGAINNNSDLTKKMLKSLSGDNEYGHLLSKYITDELAGGIKQTYGMIDLSLPRSITGNRVMGSVPTTGCETDLNKLLDLLNKLGSNFNLAVDINGALSALMAILFKLVCAGIPNAFGKITGGIPNLELLTRAGAGLILAASRNGAADVVIDVANSNVGNTVINYIPNITNVAIESLNNFDITTVNNVGDFSTEFSNSLTILNPEWKGDVNNTTIVNIYNNGEVLADVLEAGLLTETGVTSLNGEVPSDDRVNLVSALKTIKKSPTKKSVAQKTMGTSIEETVVPGGSPIDIYLRDISSVERNYKNNNLYNMALNHYRGGCGG